MKKYLFTMATAAMLFASCSSDDTVTNENGVNEEGLVEIKLGTGSNINSSVTEARGRAAVDAWNENEIGIFMLNKAATNFTETGNVELNNSKAKVSNTAGESVTIGGETVTTNIINFIDQYGEVEVPTYPRTGTLEYDFYAYHPYQSGAETVGEGTITVEGTFDGTQDIMSAMADQVEGGYNASYYKKDEKPANPNLHFKHLTTRFYIETIEGIDFDETNDACLISAATIDLPTSYTLTVAPKTDSPILWGTETEACNAYTKTLEANKYVGEIGDILVNAGETSYTLNVKFKNSDTQVVPVVVKQAGDAPFEAGKAYKIKLKISGPQNINVTASLEPWGEAVQLPEFDI